MNKTPLLLLIGPSGSGKTTIANRLEEKYGLTQIRSYTTRPKRSEAEDSHTFITEEEFMILKNLMAYTEYNGYRYCATLRQIEDCDIYVVDVPGVRTLIKNYKGNKKIIAVCLKVDEQVALDRMEQRGDSMFQRYQRLKTDDKEFDGYIAHVAYEVGAEYTYIIDNNKNNIDDSVDEIYNIIQKESKVENAYD